MNFFHQKSFLLSSLLSGEAFLNLQQVPSKGGRAIRSSINMSGIDSSVCRYFLSPFVSSEKQPLTEAALVILNSPIQTPPSPLFRELWEKSKVRVCADGGANRLFDSTQDLGATFIPDLIIGDLDSLRDDVKEYYYSKQVRIERVADQDSNDLDKSLRFIYEQMVKPYRVFAYGAFGGRFDQEMGSIHALFRWRAEFCYHLWLYDDTSCAFLLPGETLNHVELPRYGEDVSDRGAAVGEGPTCGLIPIGNHSEVVKTTGLKWNLQGTPLSFGQVVSTSNYVMEKSVSVWSSKPLVFTAEVRPG